jgi:hypothetical protein
MSWDPTLHPDEVNLRWSLLRANEWARWPIFLSQPVAPILLLVVSWKAVVLGTIVVNLLWGSFTRYRFVSVAGAYWGATLVRLKWLTCPGVAVYLFARGERVAAALSLFWPVLIFVIGASDYGGRTNSKYVHGKAWLRARNVTAFCWRRTSECIGPGLALLAPAVGRDC